MRPVRHQAQGESIDLLRSGVPRPRRASATVLRGATGAGLLGVGTLAASTYFARRILTPEPIPDDDVVVIAVDEESVTIGLTEETAVPGYYGLWLRRGDGHARVGEILDVDRSARTVRRRLIAVDAGPVRPGRARWNGYYYHARPDLSVGLACDDVVIRSDVGELPAWLVPASRSDLHARAGRDGTSPGAEVPSGDTDLLTGGTWAVLVHGRGATRVECVRPLPVLHAAGVTTLVPTYRNDEGAPPSPDGRYSLGLSEWRDVEACVRYALDHGATDLVLMGWSMGGAIVLQLLDRSPLADLVTAVVLDAPVVDWGIVIAHHGRLNHVPRPVVALTQHLIGHRRARRLVGIHEPLDVAQTNWEHRADEIRHPMLVIHSAEDEFVPVGPSRSLARRRPGLIRFDHWGGRHTKEWNVDPARYDAALAGFLADVVPGPSQRGRADRAAGAGSSVSSPATG